MSTHKLIKAAQDNDTELLRSLLAQGLDPNATAAGGETALMRAASSGHLEAVRLLLENGADVNAKRSDGFTALIRAAFFGHAEVVRALLMSGADVEAKDKLGSTAMQWASSKGYPEIVAILKKPQTAAPAVVKKVEPVVAAPPILIKPEAPAAEPLVQRAVASMSPAEVWTIETKDTVAPPPAARELTPPQKSVTIEKEAPPIVAPVATVSSASAVAARPPQPRIIESASPPPLAVKTAVVVPPRETTSSILDDERRGFDAAPSESNLGRIGLIMFAVILISAVAVYAFLQSAHRASINNEQKSGSVLNDSPSPQPAAQALTPSAASSTDEKSAQFNEGPTSSSDPNKSAVSPMQTGARRNSDVFTQTPNNAVTGPHNDSALTAHTPLPSSDNKAKPELPPVKNESEPLLTVIETSGRNERRDASASRAAQMPTEPPPPKVTPSSSTATRSATTSSVSPTPAANQTQTKKKVIRWP